MREIYIVTNPDSYVCMHVLFDGGKKEKHRKEFVKLEELLGKIPEILKGYRSGRRIKVHLEGYNSEQRKSIKLVLDKKLPKAEYYNSH